jgi:hypothetical protein
MIGFELARARKFWRLEFCNNKGIQSSGDTTLECKSEASCTRQACLFEEVHVFNTDSVQRAYCAQNHVCSDRDIHSLRT